MLNNIELIIKQDKPEVVCQNNNEIIMNSQENIVLKGNDKRIASCKKIGGEKKKTGHEREKEFLKQYNINELNSPTEYGAKSDTSIDLSHPICEILKEKLNVSGFNVSNKSGNNIQFTLGQIPEFKDIKIEEIHTTLVSDALNKYLKKINSDKPANILVYKYIEKNQWIFFNIDDIVNFISTKCIWRKLNTGRIKGDFNNNTKKGKSQYISYEYRKNHKSYFLGINGGKGKKFIDLLMDETNGIKYYCDLFNY
jgi:hypothetical protein